MKVALGIVGVVVSGLASTCLAQGGCNEPVTLPGYSCDPMNLPPPSGTHIDRKVFFFPPTSGAVPTVSASQAFAYATAIGVMDCDVVVSASGPGINYFWGTWPVHIIASGGRGEFHTVLGGTGATSDADGPPSVPVAGTSTNFPVDTKSFRGLVATAHASVDADATALAVAHNASAVFPEVTLSLNYVPDHCDDTASWGGGAGAAVSKAWVEFAVKPPTELIIDDQINIGLPPSNSGRRVFILPFTGSAAPSPIVVSPNGQVFPGWTGSAAGGELDLDMSSTVSIPEGGGTVASQTITGNDSTFDMDCDGRFTQADIDIVQAWIPIDLSTLAAASGSCPRNDDGSPNSLVGALDFNQDGIVDADDVSTLQQILDGLTSIGQQAGTFGDVNRDGVLDCSDLAASTAAWNTVLGDADYTPALDYDLDGKIDSYDQDQFYAIAKFSGDFNRSGDYSTQDIFDFLDAWYADAPGSDFNRDGDVTTQDIFDFLDAWFAGCA